jgi:uncharacterized membrane protein YraQ (UPF0718 family)
MTVLEADEPPASATAGRVSRWWSRFASIEALVLALVLVVVARPWLVGLVASPRALAAAAVFVSLVLQATPFLVLGTLLTAGIAAFVPVPMLEGVLRRDSVGLVLTSPAISPVVLAATAVAFPGEPAFVLARVVAGLLAALAAGSLWRAAMRATGRPAVPPPVHARVLAGPRGWSGFADRSRRDLVRAGGVLVLGAGAVTTLAAVLPPRWLDTLAAFPAVAVVAAGLFAVLVSPRAETDAVLISALSQFSLTSRLVFLIVGPVVNLRRFAWQSTAIGPDFALRYAPVALVAAVVAGATMGGILL